jgi:hypothetical protein
MEVSHLRAGVLEIGGLTMSRLGTTRKPAVVRVRTPERARDILDLCELQGWKVIVGVEPDRPEDVTDVERLAGDRLNLSPGQPQMVPFYFMFEEVAAKETRTAVIPGANRFGLPTGSYAFHELYCVVPGCDCRRAMLWVMRDEELTPVATINHAFTPDQDRDIGLEQTFLDPLNPQSARSQGALRLFSEEICTAEYQARLERHYRLVKDAVDDPDHPVHGRIPPAPLRVPAPIARERVSLEDGPVDFGLKKPCACGSGKKFKHCCWNRGRV